MAEDGIDAVDACRRCHFDLVLMDVSMPGMDGVTALELIRAMPTAPVVMLMTAFSAPELIARAQRAGAMVVLPKPVDLAALFALVGSVSRRPSVMLVGLSHDDNRRVCAALDARGVAVRSHPEMHPPEALAVGVDGVIADPARYSLAPATPTDALRHAHPDVRYARLVPSQVPDGCEHLADDDALDRWITSLT